VNDEHRWLDRIAHDLRGPLSPLQTAAWLLKREGAALDDARRQELADIVERQSRRLARMVDELGDWARAQQGRLLGERSACPLAQLLDLAIAATPGCLAEPRIDPGCASVQVHCDQHRLVQALATLLEHAGPEAGIALRCGDAKAELEVRGALRDADTLAQLLVAPDPAPADEGLGLRLPLAREIVRAHGGELSAAAQGDGVRLLVQLPAHA
jgi:signal transduction histidine kinase